MKYIIKKQYKVIIGMLILCVIYSIMNVGIAILLENIVDTATSKDLGKFINLIFAALIYLCLLAITYYAYSNIINRLNKNIVQEIRNNLFNGIMGKNYEEYVKHDSSAYSSILINDVNILESSYITPFISIVQNIFTFILTFILLLRYSGYIIIFLVLILALMMFIPKIIGEFMQQKQKLLSNQMQLFTKRMRDFFSGYETIKSANILGIILKKFEHDNLVISMRKYDRDNLNAISNSLSCILASFMQLSIIFIGVFLIIKGNMTLGALTAIIQLCNMFTNPVASIVQDLAEIKSTEPILKKLNYYSPSVNEKMKEKDLINFNNIILNNISYKYTKGDMNTLENVSLEIENGKKYLITGKSGCGKSTLAKLLAGYFRNYEGEIVYDDLNLKSLNQDSIYDKIAVINQNVFLFNGTILDNITLYKEYKQEQISHALKLSGIDIFINKIPKGLDAEVGENGCELSGGQRQRIAIARSIIQNKQILILDEGISAIDRQTGEDIENNILNIENLTILSISHNLKESLLCRYDQIIFLENGRIVEKGSFNTLFQNNGDFKKYFYLNQ